MLEIFRCIHGSHLYGTNVEGSDTDFKSVTVVPKWVNLRDPEVGHGGLTSNWREGLDHYMLRKGVFGTQTSAVGEGEEKEECEAFHIQEFAKLLSSMQTVCMSMVWAPRDKWITSSPAWEELVANRHRLASKAIMPYVGYARGQSVKYTLKGERLRTLIDFIDVVKSLTTQVKGNDGKLTESQWDLLTKGFGPREGVRLWENELPEDPFTHVVPASEPYIQIVGKSFSKYTRVITWLEPLEKLYKSFGNRAKAAKDDKADLKACMHAVRIVREAKEILLTSGLVYPSPDRELYLSIRRNELSYDQIQDLVIQEIDELEGLLEASTLPEFPDREWLAQWAVRWQKAQWGL